jgi:hypothetical protein
MQRTRQKLGHDGDTYWHADFLHSCAVAKATPWIMQIDIIAHAL